MYYQPHPKRTSFIGRHRIVSAFAAFAVAGCSSVVPALPASPASQAAKTLTCAQQYQAWKTGPAKASAETVIADLTALQADAKVEDIAKMDGDLQQMGKDAVSAQGFPIPACADPAGYWKQILTLMQSAGDNASVTSGLGGLITAMAPLKSVQGIEGKLGAELAKTAGVKAS